MQVALKKVEGFIVKMMEEDQASLSERIAERDNLMNTLLRASEREAAGKSSGLSD